MPLRELDAEGPATAHAQVTPVIPDGGGSPCVFWFSWSDAALHRRRPCGPARLFASALSPSSSSASLPSPCRSSHCRSFSSICGCWPSSPSPVLPWHSTEPRWLPSPSSSHAKLDASCLLATSRPSSRLQAAPCRE